MGIGFCNPIFKEAEVDKLYEHDVEIFIPKIHAFCFGDIKISIFDLSEYGGNNFTFVNFGFTFTFNHLSLVLLKISAP